MSMTGIMVIGIMGLGILTRVDRGATGRKAASNGRLLLLQYGGNMGAQAPRTLPTMNSTVAPARRVVLV